MTLSMSTRHDAIYENVFGQCFSIVKLFKPGGRFIEYVRYKEFSFRAGRTCFFRGFFFRPQACNHQYSSNYPNIGQLDFLCPFCLTGIFIHPSILLSGTIGEIALLFVAHKSNAFQGRQQRHIGYFSSFFSVFEFFDWFKFAGYRVGKIIFY